VGGRDADRPGGGFDAGAVGLLLSRSQLDEPAIRAVGLGLAVERSPEREESVVQRFPPFRLLDVTEESERAATVDGAVLELELVADLAIAGGERGGKSLIVERAVFAILAGGAFGLVRTGRARIAPVGERHAHRGEGRLVFR